MIATILPGSTNFHAVGYNEHKVSKGIARLIEIQNFGSLGTFHKPTQVSWLVISKSTVHRIAESGNRSFICHIM